ncbi:hypothetical protein VTK56DRAFT_8785 [Thermocarpiscus australiensis]
MVCTDSGAGWHAWWISGALQCTDRSVSSCKPAVARNEFAFGMWLQPGESTASLPMSWLMAYVLTFHFLASHTWIGTRDEQACRGRTRGQSFALCLSVIFCGFLLKPRTPDPWHRTPPVGPRSVRNRVLCPQITDISLFSPLPLPGTDALCPGCGETPQSSCLSSHPNLFVLTLFSSSVLRELDSQPQGR